MGEWTLFSNHGHVLVCLANNNQARLRDVAAEVGITERAVQNILRELQDSGMVQVSKHGRCNHYQISTRKSLRHPLEAHCTVGKLLQLLKSGATEESNSEEVVIERPSKSSKARSAPKPGKKGPTTASVLNTAQAEVVTPAEKGVVALKTPAESPPSQATPAAPKGEEVKAATTASKDENTTKPAGNQQGSLF